MEQYNLSPLLVQHSTTTPFLTEERYSVKLLTTQTESKQIFPRWTALIRFVAIVVLRLLRHVGLCGPTSCSAPGSSSPTSPGGGIGL